MGNHIKSRAELPHREWVEFDFELTPEGKVLKAGVKAWGCHSLLEAARSAAQEVETKGPQLSELAWKGLEHWDLLIAEAFDRAKGVFKIPVEDPETCHCRKIPTVKVDEAVVLGAHTPELVRAWTTASSGCGTCRPVVETLIQYRLKKAA